MGNPQTAHLERYRFQPGNNANPNGRPKGSRHKLSESVVRALFEDFEQHGKSAIEEVRKKRPEAYLACVCSLVPKQQEQVRSALSDIDDSELAQLEDHLRFLRAKTVEELSSDELRNTIDETQVAEKLRSYEQAQTVNGKQGSAG
jgi:hypothetical protein